MRRQTGRWKRDVDLPERMRVQADQNAGGRIRTPAGALGGGYHAEALGQLALLDLQRRELGRR